MRILDLFCGAGGAGVGYHRAFPDAHIVGVDINPQPNYPFEFVQDDVTELTRGSSFVRLFDFIHASPPCQDHSTLSALQDEHGTGWMLPAILSTLRSQPRPWVVENVAGARAEMPDAITLCGSMFGLEVRRHRLFASSFPMLAPPCAHYLQPEPIDVTGTGGPSRKGRASGGGVSRKPRNLDHARGAMGIDWMTRRELSQAIPPAYTEWIGNQLAAHLGVNA